MKKLIVICLMLCTAFAAQAANGYKKWHGRISPNHAKTSDIDSLILTRYFQVFCAFFNVVIVCTLIRGPSDRYKYSFLSSARP